MTMNNIVYTLNIYNKNISNIEKTIKKYFDVKFIAYDQHELKVSFINELSDKEEIKLFEILETAN